MTLRRLGRAVAAALILAASLHLALSPAVAAHESRRVGPYQMRVGMIGEPVHVGQESGLELVVERDGAPVPDVGGALRVEVTFGTSTMPLELVPNATGNGYEAPFVPTAPGRYSFHLFGAIGGTPVDERFTSSPTGFEEVVDAPAGEFPVSLPTISQVAADARKGADAAALAPIALGVAGLALVAGLTALGMAVAALRRSTAQT